MIRSALTILLASSLIFAGLAHARSDAGAGRYQDVTVFEAASIITMEPGYPEAKYVATSEGIILGVAQSMEELSAWTDGAM